MDNGRGTVHHTYIYIYKYIFPVFDRSLQLIGTKVVAHLPYDFSTVCIIVTLYICICTCMYIVKVSFLINLDRVLHTSC